jgi:hypothetical protein
MLWSHQDIDSVKTKRKLWIPDILYCESEFGLFRESKITFALFFELIALIEHFRPKDNLDFIHISSPSSKDMLLDDTSLTFK